MARCALPFQHRVRRAHPPARIHPRILCETVPANPSKRQQRRHHAEPQFRALERRRPLEIVQVHPLRQLLRRPRPSHFFSATSVLSVLSPFFVPCDSALPLIPQRHHGVHGSQHHQRQRERNVHQQPPMHPPVQSLLPHQLPCLLANIF